MTGRHTPEANSRGDDRRKGFTSADSNAAEVLDRPIVTTVIPSVGRPSLVRAISSALDQSGVQSRVIVVDDSGRNAAGEYATHFPVHLIATPGLVGTATAREIGIRRAQTKYIALLDDDDFMMPGHLATATKFLEGHPDHIYACRATVVGGQKARLEPAVVATDTTVSTYLFGPRVWRSKSRRVITPTLVFTDRAAHVPPRSTKAFGEDTGWLLQTEIEGMRLHINPNVGATVLANRSRELDRALDRDPLATGKDLAHLPGPAIASAYVGRLGRNAARAGQPIRVISLLTYALRHDPNPKWLGISLAQAAVSLYFKFSRTVPHE